MQLEAAQAAEIVEAALALHVLADTKAPLAFLGDTREFADWMGLEFIFD